MSTALKNISVYAPGADVTGEATGSITARTFVKISGNRASGGNLTVVAATAAGRVCGVAANDAATGELVTIARGNSRVVRVTADGAISAFAEVEVGTGAKAKAKASGVAVGYAVNGAADGADAEISLY